MIGTGDLQGYIYIGDWTDVPQGHEMKESEAAGQTIPDGDYRIYSGINQNFGLDFAGGVFDDGTYNIENGTNAQLWRWENELGVPSECDTWTVSYNGNGFYRIKQKNTNYSLDVSGCSIEMGANVQAWKNSTKNAQQWSIKATSHGYKLQARCSAYCLDVADGIAENSQNIRVWQENDSAAQSWCFIPAYPKQSVKNGLYRIRSAVNSKYYP